MFIFYKNKHPLAFCRQGDELAKHFCFVTIAGDKRYVFFVQKYISLKFFAE